MEFTDERESSLEIDKVSRWIITLAVGMIMLAQSSQCSTGTASFRNCQ
jgi:hypothetical protein